jgi:hypothetical protein
MPARTAFNMPLGRIRRTQADGVSANRDRQKQHIQAHQNSIATRQLNGLLQFLSVAWPVLPRTRYPGHCLKQQLEFFSFSEG